MIFRTTLITIFLSISPVYAAMPLSDVLQAMERQQESLTDVSFDFTQTVVTGDLPAQKTSGKVSVSKPHSIRLDWASPEKQRVISDGEKVWLYSPAAQQQIVGNWKVWLTKSHFPLPLIDFLGTFTPDVWRQRYKVLFGGYNDGLYELQFKPLSAEELPLTLWVSEKNFLPVKGRLVNAQTRINVELSGMRVNAGVDNKLFKPNVPAGVQEIPVQF